MKTILKVVQIFVIATTGAGVCSCLVDINKELLFLRQMYGYKNSVEITQKPKEG